MKEQLRQCEVEKMNFFQPIDVVSGTVFGFLYLLYLPFVPPDFLQQ